MSENVPNMPSHFELKEMESLFFFTHAKDGDDVSSKLEPRMLYLFLKSIAILPYFTCVDPTFIS